MRNTALLLLAFIFAYSFVFAKGSFNPPAAKRQAVTDNMHGFIFTDFYQWLEDKKDPEVSDWSHAQHDYTVKYLKEKTKAVDGLDDEIEKYLNRDYNGAPFFKGNREFFYARKKGQQQNKLFTRINGEVIKLFDPEEIDSSGKSALTGAAFTKDGNKAAIGLQYKGNEISEYRIVDTKTGKVEGESIKGLRGFGWTLDEEHAYIAVRTQEMIDNQVPIRTYLHTIGEDRKKDVFLVAPNDAKNFASVWDDRDGEVTFFSEGDFYSNTLSIRKAGSQAKPKVIYSSKEFRANPKAKYGKIFFYTNQEAPNFKIMWTDIDKPEFENWAEFYPEKETVLEDFEITADYVIIQEKKDVLSRLSAYDLKGNFVKTLDLPEVANVSSIKFHKESNTVFVTLGTFTSSSKVYKLDGKTLTWEFFFQDTPPIDTKDITSKLVFYPSNDGTKIPLFIIHKKGMKLDAGNPVLLYGYGGFNISMRPRYLGTTASFINRGGVYAIACLRGGDEYGENWHQAGMLRNKQNTFDDFIAAAEYLIKEEYTTSDRLAIRGGSNGGLLIGAVVTQRPDLFKAAVCAVPLLDMARYHKFLIARYWIPEYGDPDVKADLGYILTYSPYHNIREGFDYPTMLVKAGENDSRVDPLHAKKFVAALQHNPGQTNPIMLFVDFESGHGSGKSIEQSIENISLEWRFVMSLLGM